MVARQHRHGGLDSRGARLVIAGLGVGLGADHARRLLAAVGVVDELRSAAHDAAAAPVPI